MITWRADLESFERCTNEIQDFIWDVENKKEYFDLKKEKYYYNVVSKLDQTVQGFYNSDVILANHSYSGREMEVRKKLLDIKDYLKKVLTKKLDYERKIKSIHAEKYHRAVMLVFEKPEQL